MSVNERLLDNSYAVMGTLGLQLGTTNLTILKGKLPKVERSLEGLSLPLLYVACARMPGKYTRWDTGTDGVTPRNANDYLIECIAFAAGNRDPITGLDDYLDWRQVVARALGGGPWQVGYIGDNCQVYEVETHPDPPIDRSEWMNNYDVTGLHFRFTCIEPAFGNQGG